MNEVHFTQSEKSIYEEMLKCVRAQEKRLVAQIASNVKVAPSSVIKVCKKLGYPGWNEMFYTLSSTSTDAISLSFDNFDFLTDEDVNTYIKVLCEMLEKYHNHTILTVSIGDSECVGAYLLKKLWHRGFLAMPYHRGQLDCADNKPGIVFAINESGIVLLQPCLDAKEKDFAIVSITSNRQSPLACNSHMTIEIKNKKSEIVAYDPNFFAARVIIFIELLFAQYDENLEKHKANGKKK